MTLQSAVLLISCLLLCMTDNVNTRAVLRSTEEYDNEVDDFSDQNDHDSSSRRYCLTDHCIQIAEDMRSRMDLSVDPCDDFYDYACGTWVKNNEIPKEKSRYDMFAEIKEKVTTMLLELLSSPANDSDIPAIANTKNNFKACMKLDDIEQRGAQPLIAVLDSYGGWPVLGNNPGGNWNPDTFNFEHLMSKLLRDIGSSFLINTYVTTDSKESSRHLLQIDQATPSMPSRDYYLGGTQDIAEKKYLKVYYGFMLNVSLMLGAEREEAERQLQEVVDFEIAVANLTSPAENRRDMEKLYNKMTLRDLQFDVPQVNWVNYINNANFVSVDQLEEVIVREPNYVKEVMSLVSDTDQRTVANYLVWRAITNLIGQLSSEFRNANTEYSSVVFGNRAEQSRNETCMNHINYVMRFATGRLFISQHYDEKSKESTNRMIDYIQKAFGGMIDESTWMDRDTRNVAKEKVWTMLRKIGYPDWITNDDKLNEYYKYFNFSPDYHFGNYLQYVTWRIAKNFEYLRKPVDPDEWGVGPAIVNAFYDFTNNDITFPAGILQGLYYHKDSPNYLNFGGIGIVIGHEITHGFDDRGRQYDKNGNLQQWWTENSIKAYKERAQCIVDQYDQYWFEECNMTLNGVLTQGENIADNGGLKEAYKGYKIWLADRGEEEPLLPGLNLTQEQLLFLNFGQIWCSKYTEQGARNKVLSGAHSPGRYRCIGALSNSPEFADAFSCPVNSTMNPANKCSVW
ncbi:neprilysin-1-like [Ptychodera flava]|uniref:neprilysin-1-like n=1 Tax=Ptychodera flava TaxID=63121 RepID=UPI00396A7A29